jgi:hypothetical protein
MIRLKHGRECTPSISGTTTASPFFPSDFLQFKAGDDQYSGIVEGPVTCTDGTTALWVARKLPESRRNLHLQPYLLQTVVTHFPPQTQTGFPKWESPQNKS